MYKQETDHKQHSARIRTVADDIRFPLFARNLDASNFRKVITLSTIKLSESEPSRLLPLAHLLICLLA